MHCKSALVLLAVGLVGCANVDPISQSPDPAFGESVKYNTALQTIDPDPVYPADSAQPGDQGDKVQAAVKRLRTDETRTRHQAETSIAKSGSISTTESTQDSSGGPK